MRCAVFTTGTFKYSVQHNIPAAILLSDRRDSTSVHCVKEVTNTTFMLDSTLPVIGRRHDKGYTDSIREYDSDTSVYTDRDMRAAEINLYSQEVSDITVEKRITDVYNNYEMNELEPNEECQDYMKSEFVTSTASLLDELEEVMEVSEETVEVGDDDIDMEM